MLNTTREQSQYILSAQGGRVFRADPMDRLRRFLITGSSAGTYYTDGRRFTIENIKNVASLVKSPDTGIQAVKMIADVSHGGKAPKNDPALMALAVATCSESLDVRRAAWRALPSVARIGTHLQHFFQFRKAASGGKWKTSRMGRSAVERWYNAMDPQRMAYDVTKYKSRDGVSHADIIRLMHPRFDGGYSGERSQIANNILTGVDVKTDTRALEYLHACNIAPSLDQSAVIQLIREYGIPREVVPTEYLNSREIWEALFPKMPIHALVRNVNKMTAVGLFDDKEYVQAFIDLLVGDGSPFLLKKQRMHPMTLLVAARQYDKGAGMIGKLTWRPVPEITEALEEAFYIAFGAVEPTGKEICLCVDTSGSMTHGTTVGMSSREIAAAMALVTLNTEPNATVVGFSSVLYPDLQIHRKMKLLDVMKVLPEEAYNTHGKLPIEYAREMRRRYDAFIYYTDGQFNDAHGGMSFATTLESYRDWAGSATKCAVVASAANNIRVCSPDDEYALDIAGFDTSVPSTISVFIEGL